ncbi:MAG: hypothetical protein C0606_09350 [Hyphomicrobiales bacterium]|nr:MAG: hypothetical protein C0606_09350 [Hyphomicrobiales bacterium]
MVRILVMSLGWLMLNMLPVAAAPIACGGVDMLATLREEDAAKYRELVEKAGAVPNGRGRLWRIEVPGARPSYLFGTIHFTDERVHAFPQSVIAALDEAKVGAVESLAVLDDPMDPAVLERAGANPMLPDGQTLDDVLDESDRSLLKSAMARRLLSYEVHKIQKPWVVSQLLSYPPCELGSLVLGNPIVDKRVAETIRLEGKTLLGLETAEEQFASLDGMPIKTQIALLRMSAQLSPRIDDIHETFLNLYRASDIGMIDALSVHLAGPDLDPAVYRDFMDHLLVRRNVRMHERALPQVKKGGIFIAVGALHLPGKEGLVAMFRRDGYTVTLVE